MTLHSDSIMLLMTPKNLERSVANVILFDDLQHLFVRFLMICYGIDFNMCCQNILATSQGPNMKILDICNPVGMCPDIIFDFGRINT